MTIIVRAVYTFQLSILNGASHHKTVPLDNVTVREYLKQQFLCF